VFGLGTAFSLERDLAAYDAGLQFNRADVVVSRVADAERAIEYLYDLKPLSLEAVKAWEAEPRRLSLLQPLSRPAIRDCLTRVPSTFGICGVYCKWERLTSRRVPGALDFDLIGIDDEP